MKPNIIHIYPKGTFGDKMLNFQVITSQENKSLIKQIVHLISQRDYLWVKYNHLGLFIQGDHDDWIMIEALGMQDHDAFFAFCLEIKKLIKAEDINIV